MAVPLRCPNCRDNLGKDVENPRDAYCGECGTSFKNPRGYLECGKCGGEKQGRMCPVCDCPACNELSDIHSCEAELEAEMDYEADLQHGDVPFHAEYDM